MKQEHIERIKSYYDRTGEFKKNEKYSGRDKTVYTKDGDRYRWLVMEPEGASGMKVHQTDAHGKITAQDTYESVGNVVKCTGVERLCADGRGMVQFTAEETDLIGRLGGEKREDTAANFEKAMQGMGGCGKKIMERTVRKLSELSDQGCAELTATTRNRKEGERDFSVLYRLSKIRERRKEAENTKGQEPGRKKKSRGIEL